MDPSRTFPFGWGFRFGHRRLALARTQPQRGPWAYFGLAFPAAVAPTIAMTVPTRSAVLSTQFGGSTRVSVMSILLTQPRRLARLFMLALCRSDF
jgi:hypothetical protein